MNPTVGWGYGDGGFGTGWLGLGVGIRGDEGTRFLMNRGLVGIIQESSKGTVGLEERCRRGVKAVVAMRGPAGCFIIDCGLEVNARQMAI